VPLEQTWFCAQVLPQVPQLVGSLRRSTQLLLQLVYPPLQATPQLPPAQVAFPFGGTGQTWPQPPQSSGSLDVLTQLPPQSV
jgi:hypothetical protein